MSGSDIFALGVMIATMLVFILPGIYYLCIYIKEKIAYKTRAESQHLMFNQLKKGDFVWQIFNNELIHYMIEKVEYSFYDNGSLHRINIQVNACDTLHIRPEEAKVFKYDKYYALYSEAKAAHNLITARRKQEINNVTSVSLEIVKEEADKAIKRIESLKKQLA